jgi:SAM-dependent methyltransferase
MDASYAQQYQELWRHHWWWQARHHLIMEKLAKLLPPRQPTQEPAKVLDIGCGGGVAFADFSRFGDIHGLEPDPQLADSLPDWRGRVEQTLFHAGFQSECRYDLILMLDVLEHIEDDRGALANVLRLLQPGGFYFMTVPALPALWSAHDEANHHFRRYQRAALHRLLVEQGFDVQEVRYIFGWSLGLVYLRRWLSRRDEGSYRVKIPPRWANAPCYWLSRAEEWLTWRKGPPLGSSLLAIARKPSVEVGVQSGERVA